MVTVVHGENVERSELAGRTVEEARVLYGHAFNMEPDATAMVNGQQVADTYVLKDGDRLEFHKTVVKGLAA